MKKFRLYFEPVIIRAKDLQEVDRRIDDGEFMDAVIKDVVEVENE
jgi:hypothetical protein